MLILSHHISTLAPTFIKKYFKKTISYSPLRFIVELGIIATIGKILLVIFPGTLIIALRNGAVSELTTPSYMEITNKIFLFFLLSIFSPVIETIIFQWLPITLLQKITSNIKFIIGTVTLIFALVHLVYSLLYVITVLPASLILAWSFFLYKKASLPKALLVTTSIHAVFNFVAFLAIVIL